MDLEHVARFVAAPELIALDDLTMPDRRQLPEHWLHALAGDRAWRVSEVLKRWNHFGRPIMSDTYTTITASLADVALLKSRGEWFLLYRITAADGDDMYYLGGRPVTEDDDVPAVWHHFPASLTRFYTHLHNGWYGWYYIAGKTVGPLPLREMFRIDAFEWGILDGLSPRPVPRPLPLRRNIPLRRRRIPLPAHRRGRRQRGRVVVRRAPALR
ncbi:MAG: hypothetical protein OJJ55_02145 [Rhodococcus sp.]|nr:hypothetical protein [Rhodococcus sp. (in: high G+C Gram-positive bacteria)]